MHALGQNDIVVKVRNLQKQPRKVVRVQKMCLFTGRLLGQDFAPTPAVVVELAVDAIFAESCQVHNNDALKHP